MKKSSKIAVLLITILAIVGIAFSNPIYADTTGDTKVPTFSEIVSQGQAFVSQTPTITEEQAIGQLVPVGQILVGIASVVLVGVGLVLGVKYMWAGANERAQLKQRLIWYVIAIIVVYGGIGIFTMIRNVMNTVLA